VTCEPVCKPRHLRREILIDKNLLSELACFSNIGLWIITDKDDRASYMMPAEFHREERRTRKLRQSFSPNLTRSLDPLLGVFHELVVPAKIIVIDVLIPDDVAEPTISQDCAGNYEYMPDGSWKGTGTCTDNYPEGKISLTWDEGSHLKEYTYTKTGGTGNYQGVKGGGTYMYQNLSDTLSGGQYKGTIELP